MTARVVIPARRVCLVLLACALTLTALSAAGWYLRLAVDPRWTSLAHVFDVDRERSLPTLFSILDLAFSTVLLAAVAGLLPAGTDRRDLFSWRLLLCGFAFLCLDEQLCIHEKLAELIQARWQLTGYWTFGWVIPALLLLPVLGAAFFGFLRRLPARRRAQFLAAGALFVTGAVGIEMLSGKFGPDDASRTNLAYAACVHAEELLEMTGIVLFNYALLEHVAELLAGNGLALEVSPR